MPAGRELDAQRVAGSGEIAAGLAGVVIGHRVAPRCRLAHAGPRLVARPYHTAWGPASLKHEEGSGAFALGLRGRPCPDHHGRVPQDGTAGAPAPGAVAPLAVALDVLGTIEHNLDPTNGMAGVGGGIFAWLLGLFAVVLFATGPLAIALDRRKAAVADALLDASS